MTLPKKLEILWNLPQLAILAANFSTPSPLKRSRIRSGPSYVQVETKPVIMEPVGEVSTEKGGASASTTPQGSPRNTPPGSPPKSPSKSIASVHNEVVDSGDTGEDLEMELLASQRREALTKQRELLAEKRCLEERAMLETETRTNEMLQADLHRLQEQSAQSAACAKTEAEEHARRAQLLSDEIGKFNEEQKEFEDELRIKRAKMAMEHKKQLLEMQHRIDIERMMHEQSLHEQSLQAQWEKEQEAAKRVRTEGPAVIANQGTGVPQTANVLESGVTQACVDQWMQGVSQAAGSGGVHDLHGVSSAMTRGAVVTHETSSINVLLEIGVTNPIIDAIAQHASLGRASAVRGDSVPRQFSADGQPEKVIPVTDPLTVTEQVRSQEVTAMAVVPPVVSADVRRTLETDEDEDGESLMSKVKNKKLKSGMLALPSDNIKSVEVWPQFSLQYGYAAAPLKFEQMTFEQLVAGELRTIMGCSDAVEVRGRLALLFRITHLKMHGYLWSVLRAFYAAVVRAIEQHESTWASDWKAIEEFCIDPGDRVKTKTDKVKPPSKVGAAEWFCKNYNRVEGCQLRAPHEAMVGRPPKRRQVRHFCAQCWITDQTVRMHSEVDAECPHHA